MKRFQLYQLELKKNKKGIQFVQSKDVLHFFKYQNFDLKLISSKFNNKSFI